MPSVSLWMTSSALLVLAHLQQFVDEILVGLQRAQQFGEVLARALELADRAFRRGLELAPALDQELPVFRLVARLRSSALSLSSARLSALSPRLKTAPLSATAPSSLPT